MENNKTLFNLVIFTFLLTVVNLYVSYTLYVKIRDNKINLRTDNQVVASIAPAPSQAPPKQVKVDLGNGPQKGAANAPVTIVQFSDYQCPFCQRFTAETFPQIDEKYIKTGKVKFVYRDFPLSFHESAQKAAEAARCAFAQNNFFEYHDIVFKNQSAIAISDLKKYAKDLGLDVAKFNACLDSGKTAADVKKDLADGASYGVNGTPSFFINGWILVGAQPFSVFQQAIESELKKKNL